jgi:hypothetical protein
MKKSEIAFEVKLDDYDMDWTGSESTITLQICEDEITSVKVVIEKETKFVT